MGTKTDFLDQNTYAQTRLPISLASTLIPDAYRSDEFYAIESERLWATSWICVGYTQQLVNVGDTILATINNQPLIITRTASDRLCGFYNVCRHRGAEVLSKAGNYSFFRCPYHAWGYALDGRLKGTPYFEDGEISPEMLAIYETTGADKFDKAQYGLLPVKVAEWGCFVFANLDVDCAPLEEQIGDIPYRLRNYPLKELELTKQSRYEITSNWKLVAENFMEFYHLPTVHPSLNLVSHLRNHYPFQGPGWYYGMTTRPLDKDPSVPIDRELPRMPGLDEEERQSARWLWLFPNFSISLLPDYMIAMVLFPDGPGRTKEHYDYFFHPSTKVTPLFEERASDIYRFWHEVNTEDIGIVESVQRGLQNRAYRGGRMCFRFEETIHRFQNHVIDKIISGVRSETTVTQLDGEPGRRRTCN